MFKEPQKISDVYFCLLSSTISVISHDTSFYSWANWKARPIEWQSSSSFSPGSQKQQAFDQSNGRQDGQSLNVRSQAHNTFKVQTIKHKAAKVNYIKLNESGGGEPARVGQSYLFWIGGYWLQAGGYHGKVPFFVGLHWELSSLQPRSGIYTIENANAKDFREQLHIGRLVIDNWMSLL